jgi:tRNA (guanine37-N1)-methyltransferase
VRIDIVTIFGEYFAPLNASLIGRAVQRGDIALTVHDLRRWTADVHHAVDDAPFGGGPGMVMTPEPWGQALDDIVRPGRYEGIDARVAADARSRMTVDEVSIGDYVLPGGEAAVLVMAETVCRLLPGVLGNTQSAPDDSFGGGSGGTMAGLVEGPAYTRPRVWRGQEVPAVLLSGDHGAIARWRRDSALRRTARNRPDLVRQLMAAGPGVLSDRDREVLEEVLDEAGFPVSRQDMAH